MNTVEAIKSISQINQMKEYLQSRSPRDYCFFMLGINTGIRLNDLLNIHVMDVLSEVGEIRTYLQSNIYIDPPVFLNNEVKQAIYMNIKDENLEQNDFLFKSRKTKKPITRQQAYRIINEAAKHAGIKDAIGTHTLRKTFGYHAYRKGIAVSLIQKRLQQASPSETIHYIGLSDRKYSLPIILDVNL